MARRQTADFPMEIRFFVPLLVLSACLCPEIAAEFEFEQLEGGARADAQALSAFARGIRGGILDAWNVEASGEPCAWRGVDCAWIQSSGGDGEEFRVVGLELPSSQLEGTISAQLGLLSELRTLDLSGNRLFGPVPPEIGALPELSHVDLSYNRLYGPIPYGKSFKRDGFLGNPELCGWPLEQACSALAPSSFPLVSGSSVLSTIAAWFSSLSSRQQKASSRRAIARRFMKESGNTSTRRLAPAPGPLSARIQAPAPSPLPPKAHKSKLRRWGLGIAFGVLVGAGAGLVAGSIGRIGKLIWKRRRTQNGPIIFHHKISPKMLAFLDNPESIEQMDVVGAGGAGKVYKATLENGFVVAIKRIPIKPPEESNGGSSFGKHHTVAEMETLGKIRHRNLAWLYAYIRKPDAHLLLYHFMPNGSMHDALARVREGALVLDWKARQRIAIDMATGLKYLHYDCTPKILHRDLKTSNVLLDENCNAHLGDFGLAKALPDDMTHVTTQVAGTVGYIAPEYHQTCKFTTSSDVYSMGIVLGVLLCGKEPVDEFFQDVPGGMVGWMCYLVQTGQELRGIDPKLIRVPPENDDGAAAEDAAGNEAPAAEDAGNEAPAAAAGDRDDGTTQLHELAEMKLTMRIACLCTKPNPADRPSIKDVLVMLNPSKLALFRPINELISE